MPLPFCDRFGTRRRSNVTTFDFAPVFSRLIDRAPPGVGIAQRAFDRELSPIFIDEDQKMRDLLTALILLGLTLHSRHPRVLELEPIDVAFFSLFEGGWRIIHHHRPGLRASGIGG